MLFYLYTSDYEEMTRDIVMQGDQDIQSNPPLTDAMDYERLVNHVHMYVIADKYEIDGLKDLAKSKFQASVEGCWPIPYFQTLVLEILVSTPSKDLGLREVIKTVCADHITELLNEDVISEDAQITNIHHPANDQEVVHWSQIFAEEGTFTTAVLAQVAHKSAEQLKSVDTAYAEMLEQFETYKEKCIKDKEKLRQAKEELNEYKAMLRAAARQSRCCGDAGFSVHFMPGTWRSQPRLRLKCAACYKFCN